MRYFSYGAAIAFGAIVGKLFNPDLNGELAVLGLVWGFGEDCI